MSPGRIVIISQQNSPRLEYVVDFIFGQVLGCEVYITDKPGLNSGLHIEYGTSNPDNTLSMVSSGLLFETGVREKWVDILEGQQINEWFVPETKINGFDFDQDLFALVFFFLSRYEEYLPFKGDSLGRFCAADSIAWRKNILQIPVVDNAIKLLRDIVEKRFDVLLPKPLQEFQIKPTIDVDQIWAFHRKGWKNIAASFTHLTKGNLSMLKQRWLAWLYAEKDPFHTWVLLDEIHRNTDSEPVYFILTAPEQTELDKNHLPSDAKVRKQFKELAEKHITGLHPSSQCMKNSGQLVREKSIFENIIGQSVSRSRMHYLLLRLPETYRMLLEGGITHDYTMGFHDAVGYRAGTGFDFYWYDLEMEKKTELRITPFQLMDVTLKVHQKVPSSKASGYIRNLIETAQYYNSPFTVVWHNSSFYDQHGWGGWEEVYRSIFADAF